MNIPSDISTHIDQPHFMAIWPEPSLTDTVSRPLWLSWMRVRLVIRRLWVWPLLGWQHSFVEIFFNHSFSSADSRRTVVSFLGQRMCTILVNRCPIKVWLGKLTTLDMISMGWLGSKNSTQTDTHSGSIGRASTLWPGGWGFNPQQS